MTFFLNDFIEGRRQIFGEKQPICSPPVFLYLRRARTRPLARITETERITEVNRNELM